MPLCCEKLYKPSQSSVFPKIILPEKLYKQRSEIYFSPVLHSFI